MYMILLARFSVLIHSAAYLLTIAVPCCAVPCCAVLYFAVLRCAVLCCAVLYYGALCEDDLVMAVESGLLFNNANVGTNV